MMSDFVPSRYQQVIFERVDAAYEHQQFTSIVISAVAGSGKSTTLRELLAHVPPHLRVLFLTFGHDINEDQTLKVREYAKRRKKLKLPVAQASCMTIHSLGASSLHAMGIHGNPEKGRRKYHRLAQAYLKEAQKDAYSYQLALQLKALIDKVRVTLTDPTEAHLVRLLQRFTDIDINPEEKENWRLVVKAVPVLLSKGIELAQSPLHEIDFTDQIWLPSSQALNLTPRQYDVVLTDEAQDL
jgi:superfamily I DNA/RNA helicase